MRWHAETSETGCTRSFTPCDGARNRGNFHLSDRWGPRGLPNTVGSPLGRGTPRCSCLGAARQPFPPLYLHGETEPIGGYAEAADRICGELKPPIGSLWPPV